MRLPRVRLTLRRLLIAAAVAEAAAGAEALRRRSEGFRDLARYHSSEERVFLGQARLWEEGPGVGCSDVAPVPTPEGAAQEARRCRRRAAFEAALSRKYDRAAARPWLPVEVDAAEPQ